MQDYVQTSYSWTTNMTTDMPASWEEPHVRKPFGQRRPIGTFQLPMVPGSTHTGQTTEGSQSPYSRRQSKPVDNRSATVGWSLITKTQLLTEGWRNWPYVAGPSSFTTPDCGRKQWLPYCDPSPSRKSSRGSTSWKVMRAERLQIRSFLVWSSKFSLQTTTPGAAPYFS